MRRVLVGVILLAMSLGSITLGQETKNSSYTPFEIATAFANCRYLRSSAAETARRFPIQQVGRNVVTESDLLRWLEQCVLETLEGRRVEVVPVD
jgi:hypothetical protein